MGETYVAIPEKIKIPTREMVLMTPNPDEKARYRRGRKEVGMILNSQSILQFYEMQSWYDTYIVKPTSFHSSLEYIGHTTAKVSEKSTTNAILNPYQLFFG